VDYWFSKENLITDDNLRDELIGCKYGKNDEVPLTKFNWWRAMRNCFQTKCGMNSQNTSGRKEIMEALEDSTTVDIVGPELVRRKLPFTMDSASHRGVANGINGAAGQNGSLTSSSNSIAPSNEPAATDEEEGEDSEDGVWTTADKEKLFVQLDLRKNKKKMVSTKHQLSFLTTDAFTERCDRLRRTVCRRSTHDRRVEREPGLLQSCSSSSRPH
jgi:hypothetical protein